MKTLILLIAVILSGCVESKQENFKWTILKSPLTGRCYEVATRSLGLETGVAMMAEIPCTDNLSKAMMGNNFNFEIEIEPKVVGSEPESIVANDPVAPDRLIDCTWCA